MDAVVFIGSVHMPTLPRLDEPLAAAVCPCPGQDVLLRLDRLSGRFLPLPVLSEGSTSTTRDTITCFLFHLIRSPSSPPLQLLNHFKRSQFALAVLTHHIPTRAHPL